MERHQLRQPMDRREVLRFIGSAIVMCAAAGRQLGDVHTPERLAAAHGYHKNAEALCSALMRLETARKARRAFLEKTGVPPPVFVEFGALLDLADIAEAGRLRPALFGRATRGSHELDADTIYAQMSIAAGLVDTGWGSRLSETPPPPRVDFQEMEPIQAHQVADQIGAAYKLLPVMGHISPPRILIAPQTDDICGKNTGGCAQKGVHLTMDAVPGPFENVRLYIFLHEMNHFLDWNLHQIIPFVQEEHARVLLERVYVFFDELATTMPEINPAALEQAGGMLGRYSEAVFTSGQAASPGSIQYRYPAAARIAKKLAADESEKGTFPTEPTELYAPQILHGHMLPLAAHLLKLLQQNAWIDGQPLRENPAVRLYLDSVFRLFAHRLIDPVLEELDARAAQNTFMRWLWKWQRAISNARLRLLSRGGIPLDCGIAEIQEIFGLRQTEQPDNAAAPARTNREPLTPANPLPGTLPLPPRQSR